MYCILIFLVILVFINNKNHIIENIKYIDQTKDYPTGCESISTVMCINYWNISIKPEEFIDNYLEKGIFYYKNGQLFAPHPSDKFIGSPYDSNSYGCYEPVIEKALNKLISDRKVNFEVVNLTNVEMDKIKSDYIDNDIPVIFWATIDMKPFINGSIWIIPETGEQFQWRGREHCLLLIGYDDEDGIYYLLDPWENHKKINVTKTLLEQRHKEQYSMAVALKRK